MNRLLCAIVLLALAACGGGGDPSPTYSPPPPVAIPPPPGDLVFSADWSAPLSAAGTCGGSPFACHLPPGTQWGLQQQSDTDYISVEAGELVFKRDPNGMSMVNVMTFDHTKPMSVEEVLRIDTLDCTNSISYSGPVIYGGGVDDGDPTGRYRAMYISCFPGDTQLKIWLYSPTWAGAMPGGPYLVNVGETHKLRMDWLPGQSVSYYMDDRLLFTETPAFGHDPLDVPTDPHPSTWLGGPSGAIKSYKAWGTKS